MITNILYLNVKIILVQQKTIKKKILIFILLIDNKKIIRILRANKRIFLTSKSSGQQESKQQDIRINEQN